MPASRRRIRFRLPRTPVGGGPSRAARPTSPPSPDRPIVFFVPARDEAPRIGAVLDRIPVVVHGHRVVAVVVDDGSGDDTAAVARRHGAEVVGHPGNLGLGAAVRSGLARSVELEAAAVAFCDGDGEYDPAELDRLVRPILAGHADYVVGSRFTGRIEVMRPHRRVGNRLLTLWVRWMVREPVTDGQSGFRALSADAARSARIAHDYNYAQVLTVDLVGRGFRYAEVPISYRFRTSGRSFVRLGRYVRRVVPTVHRVLAEMHDRQEQPTGVDTERRVVRSAA